MEHLLTLNLKELIHVRLQDSTLKLFEGGHYSSCAREALIIVEEALKEKGIFDKSFYGARLIKFAFKKENPTLHVPLGEEYQEFSKDYFQAVFSYYRNFTAHNTKEIEKKVCIRILIIASELLDIISASTVPFRGLATVERLVKSGLFKDEQDFKNLLEFMNGYQCPGDTYDGFFYDLAHVGGEGYSEEQYQIMFEFGLIVYTVVPVENDFDDTFYIDEIGIFELTDVGETYLSNFK